MTTSKLPKPGAYTSYVEQENREFTDEEGTYEESVSVLRCALCYEEITAEDDHGCCAEGVFAEAAERLQGDGITFYQRRCMEDYGLWENDTLLLLAQGELSLKAFNARVRRIFKRDNPGYTFKSWGFSFEFESDGPYDGSGRIWASSAEFAPAVAEALFDLAQQLSSGKYKADVSWA